MSITTSASETNKRPINHFDFYHDEYFKTHNFIYGTKIIDSKPVTYLHLFDKIKNEIVESHEGSSKKKAREAFIKNTSLPKPERLVKAELEVTKQSVKIDEAKISETQVDELSGYEPSCKRKADWPNQNEHIDVIINEEQKPEPESKPGGIFNKYFTAYKNYLLFKTFYQQKNQQTYRFVLLIYNGEKDNSKNIFEMFSYDGVGKSSLKQIRDKCFERFVQNTKLPHPETLPSKKEERDTAIKKILYDTVWEFYKDQ